MANLFLKASLEGAIPDFAWLDNGLISQMKYKAGPEAFDEEDDEGLDDEEHRDALIDSMVQSVKYSEFYSEESLSALERELSLAPGWEYELAESVLNNLEAGRNDLHGLNFGFRNGKFVFFDA